MHHVRSTILAGSARDGQVAPIRREFAMKHIPLSRLAGAVLVLLGSTVMLGWWMQLSLLVRVLPEFTPMVFNTVTWSPTLMEPFSNS